MHSRRCFVAISAVVVASMCFMACGPKNMLPGPDEFVEYQKPPQPTFQPPPEYPQAAKDAGIEGMVKLHVLIDKEGAVRDIKLIQGIGGGIDEAAIESVRQSKWTPAMHDDEPVAVWVTYPIRFKMRGPE